MSSGSIQKTTKRFSSLRRAMRSNGIFSALSGIIFLIGARSLADFAGLTTPVILTVLGGVLLFYATALFWVTAQPLLDKRLGTTAVVLDIGWVVGSTVILLTGWPSLTVAGNWTVALLAEVVLFFAIWQGYALRQTDMS